MEGIADALMDIADEASVPSIIKALEYEVGGDADYHFNRKLVQALYNIGTGEAIEGIKRASQSSKELLQEEAIRKLKKVDRGAA